MTPFRYVIADGMWTSMPLSNQVSNFVLSKGIPPTLHAVSIYICYQHKFYS